MIAALQWIKQYIRDFGGDPENITLFGQSSGGDAIAHLMISEETENLFRRVIIHSAPLGFRVNRQKMSHEFFLKTDILKDEPDALKMVARYRTFTFFQKIRIEDLHAILHAIWPSSAMPGRRNHGELETKCKEV